MKHFTIAAVANEPIARTYCGIYANAVDVVHPVLYALAHREMMPEDVEMNPAYKPENICPACRAALVDFRLKNGEHRECLDCDDLSSVHRADMTHCTCGDPWPCETAISMGMRA